MDIKKVTLTRYSVIVNGADAKKAIKPMQDVSNEAMYLDTFDFNSAVICCATFSDVRNCLAILKKTGCSSAIVNLERVYNECNSSIIKSVTCALNTYIKKELLKLEDYREYLKPAVKECFDEAIKVVREKVGNECAKTIINEHLIPSLVDYNEANFMHGYFRACAQMLPEHRNLFYTASIAMIHFKYYHYNEEYKNHD